MVPDDLDSMRRHCGRPLEPLWMHTGCWCCRSPVPLFLAQDTCIDDHNSIAVAVDTIVAGGIQRMFVAVAVVLFAAVGTDVVGGAEGATFRRRLLFENQDRFLLAVGCARSLSMRLHSWWQLEGADAVVAARKEVALLELPAEQQ